MTTKTTDTAELDARMKAAGMIPVSVMLEQNALGKYSAHAGVHDLEAFEQWLKMRLESSIRLQAQLELDENEDDELYEWSIAHVAVFGEVLANFRQATGRGEA